MQSGLKSREAYAGWVAVNIHRHCERSEPRQGHLCNAAGGQGLLTSPTSPFGEGDKCLPNLVIQSQPLRPTILGLDGNLSVGTELLKGTGRPRRPERTLSWRSHPWPDGALNQQRRHDLDGWSRGKVVGRRGWVGGGGRLRPIPSNHRRHRAPSRHHRGPSRGQRARRGPQVPGPCLRAGRRGPR